MTCPFFVDAVRCRCLAVEEEIVPTIHERTLHCRAAFESCPTYRAQQMRGQAIPLAVYEHIWYAPLGATAELDLGS